ncbi:MAG: hypothetical protein OEQ29_01250 [Alphaproteobacteria bacterium]|nr:hypothetical protein [Alphaproteobacteria bacterium]
MATGFDPVGFGAPPVLAAPIILIALILVFREPALRPPRQLG